MKKLLYNPITLLVIVIGVGAFSLSLARDRARLAARQVELDASRALLNQTKSELESLQTATDSVAAAFTIETTLRNELLLQKPGEWVIQMPPTDQKTTPEHPQESDEKNIPKQWLTLLLQ